MTESNYGSLLAPLLDKMLEVKGSELFVNANEVPRIRVNRNGSAEYLRIEGAEPTPSHALTETITGIRGATGGNNGMYFHGTERFRFCLEGDFIVLRHIPTLDDATLVSISEAAEIMKAKYPTGVGPKSLSIFVDETPYKADSAPDTNDTKD